MHADNYALFITLSSQVREPDTRAGRCVCPMAVGAVDVAVTACDDAQISRPTATGNPHCA